MKCAALLSIIFSLVISLAAPTGAAFALEEDQLPPVPDPGVVISQIHIGNASQPRLVEIYNNSDAAADVTGWCIRYHASGTPFDSASQRHCIVTGDNIYRAILPARTHVAFLQHSLSGGLGTGAAGRVYITSATSQLVDIVSWDTTPDANDFSMPAVAAERPRLLERKMIDETSYQDTDNNSDDMFASVLRSDYQTDSIIELPDYCTNIEGLQLGIPEGLEWSDEYICVEPVSFCKNMPDIRIDALPDHFEVDDEGNCYEDTCINLDGFQDAPPNGFLSHEDGTCLLSYVPLVITELLPNPSGSDAGNEFIEIYNPNDEAVDLAWWRLYNNNDFEKPHSFPEETVIEPKSYFVYTNTFLLTNTAGTLRLASVDGQHAVDVPEWTNARDNHAWALVEEEWQYTTVPTPGKENIPTPGRGENNVVVATLADCGEGRERNPATNRCRNIPTMRELAPCQEGQYRSEETNRCRSIATAAAAVLKPCADDQFRNPETNRCKKIASSDEIALADCGEGRERNPETNRCRNVLGVNTLAETMPFPVENIEQGERRFTGWWTIGVVVLLGAGYGAWEWREELKQAGRRVGQFVGRSK